MLDIGDQIFFITDTVQEIRGYYYPDFLKHSAFLNPAGGGGGGAPACCVRLENVMATCGFDIVDMIPVRRQNLDVKLPALELAGQWLAQNIEPT